MGLCPTKSSSFNPWDSSQSIGTGSMAMSATKEIDHLWQFISRNVSKWQRRYNLESINNHSDISKMDDRPKQTRNGWKVVRVFVSSTFSDFHAEREILVKQVFPELREWCEKRCIHIVECDLRWGVPKDTSTPDTIGICLEEIENCIKLTDGKPFFINLLGSRYGWVPLITDLSEEIIEKYDWIESLSITHMEIIHAALRTKSKNAAFFIRDDAFCTQIPSDFLSSFVDNSSVNNVRLKKLKLSLKEEYTSQCYSYFPTVLGKEMYLGSEKLKLGNLEYFTESVSTFLKDRINKQYPFDDNENEELTPEEEIRRSQEAFIIKKGSLLVGRENEMKEIMEFIKPTSSDQKVHKSLMLILGELGIGKSSLAANVVLEAGKNYHHVFYNFASASPGSILPSSILKRFIIELHQLAKTDYVIQDNEAVEALEKEFCSLVQKLNENLPHSYVFIIDAINQVSGKMGHTLSWIPTDQIPSNVKFIISSTLDHQEVNTFVEEMQNKINILHLSGFDQENKTILVTSTLNQYNKKLDNNQLDLLIGHTGSHSPLWLALACEELRLFGIFEQVTATIEKLPGSVEELLSFILMRIVSEDETKLVERILCYLYCSMHGLTESDLRQLLGEGEGIAMVTWATARRKIKSFLIHSGASHDEEFFTYFHHSMKKVVYDRFICNEKTVQDHHRHLAEYLSRSCTDGERFSREYPHYLAGSKNTKELQRFFRKDQRAKKLHQYVKSSYLKPFRCHRYLASVPKTFISPVIICVTCSMMSGDLIQGPFKNKDSCVICASLIQFKNTLEVAMLCQFHRTSNAPGWTKCFICNKSFVIGNDKQLSTHRFYTECYICRWCSLTQKRCCYVG